MRLLAGLITALAMQGPAALADACKLDSTDQIPFEVLRAGDDGLTNRLADAIVKAFTSDCPQAFALSDGGYAALVVKLDRNVQWSQEGRRTRIYYSVSFLAQGGRRSHSTGSCWEDLMDRCAARIRKAAPIVSMA